MNQAITSRLIENIDDDTDIDQYTSQNKKQANIIDLICM